ncbi:MAG TPA: COX15/CtaA family protein [Opitutaceae bacterium]
MSSTPSPSPVYRPALAWFAALGSAWVFVLVMLGAFTTTIGAGMAFKDWPLSNGSLNPHGWLSNIAMFAEHSHRLSATTMGILTTILAIWITIVEERTWVKKIAWAAFGIVVLQGVLGGLRVLLNNWNPEAAEMSVGQLLRIPHGILAQIYVVVLFSISAAVSKTWTTASTRALAASPRVRTWGIVCVSLVLVQLAIAATMRHFSAGLAIPTFPLTPEGTLLPIAWNFRIAIHFAHRAMALVLTITLVGFAWVVWREKPASKFLKNLAAAMLSCLVLQIFLGISIIWTLRDPYFTTAHVLVGALTLATTFLLTWFAHRNQVEFPTEARALNVSLSGATVNDAELSSARPSAHSS